MMISPVSMSASAYNVSSIYNYGVRYTPRLARSAQRAAMPEAPVSPVRSSPAVHADAPGRVRLSADLWARSYHAEQAARSRVQYMGGSPTGSGTKASGLSQASQDPASLSLPGQDPTSQAAEQAARMRVQYPPLPGSDKLPGHEGVDTKTALGADGAQQAAEEGRCQTCEERKYQDGSNDSSVSYQTPTRIDPDAAQAAVRGHELEHVAHEQAKAQRDGRKVVSQTVSLKTDICPECGRVYVSGGSTRTVTKEKAEMPAPEQPGAGNPAKK